MPRLGLLLALTCFLLLPHFCAGTPQSKVDEAARGLRIADDYQLAKKWLYGEVFFDRRETLYCGCGFDAERRPDHAGCGYRSPGGSERARQIEAEHVVPASWIGQGRACWERPVCVDRDGDRYRGRECCLRIDLAYRRAHNDLHNLWPTVGEVNQARSNYRFGLIPGEPRPFGQCDFEVDHGARVAEPRPAIRGDIARIAFYMEAIHGVWLSPGQRALLESWHRADPPDDFERTRNARIRRLQGQGNPFVEQYEAVGTAASAVAAAYD